MADMQGTLAIIKPDAVAAGNMGAILTRIEQSGLTISAAKFAHLTAQQARGFYHVHADKKFFNDLVQFMTSGPVLLLSLEGENAIARWRELLGPTDSEKARKEQPKSIRALYGTDIQNNACHGSDSPENAAFEISYFFNVFDFAL